jgi:hypothetical protein
MQALGRHLDAGFTVDNDSSSSEEDAGGETTPLRPSSRQRDNARVRKQGSILMAGVRRFGGGPRACTAYFGAVQ